MFSTNGRASRREFWAVFLPVVLWNAVLIWLLETLAPHGIRSLLTGIAVLVFLMLPPDWLGIAVVVRRLHDLGRSGIWMVAFSVAARLGQHLYRGLDEGWPRVLCAAAFVLGAVGFAGILGLRPGELADNRYGPNPLTAPSRVVDPLHVRPR
jgi:uncharacterized membrane protein YhaH (DUF805 family)